MSNEIKTIGVKVPIEFYVKIKGYADSNGISISDFIRDLMEKQLNGNQQSSNEGSNDVKQMFDALFEQLRIKDDQIEQLHQLLAMKEKTTANLTEERMFIKSQLEHANLQLEYLQNRPTVWQKLKTLFVSRTN